MEHEEIVKIFDALGGDESLLELWLDYEEERTPEGRFVKACDKLDMALQASVYSENQGLDLSEFINSALDRLDDDVLCLLASG
jgi:5'-deoxynucleotidase YfbR-like HD superfamily hydrolase